MLLCDITQECDSTKDNFSKNMYHHGENIPLGCDYSKGWPSGVSSHDNKLFILMQCFPVLYSDSAFSNWTSLKNTLYYMYK